MYSKLIKTIGTWQDVATAANTTVHKSECLKEPSSKWKRKLLLAEHSPIRNLIFVITMYDLPSWVSVHFVRHKIGVEHFVSTQRTDRTGKDRNLLQQNEPVTHQLTINAQAIINISRKRLCTNASPETREAWKSVLETIKASQPELYSVCVPECVYRGFCPEMKCCGFVASEKFKNDIELYRKFLDVKEKNLE